MQQMIHFSHNYKFGPILSDGSRSYARLGPYRTGIEEPRMLESPEDLTADELNSIIRREGRRRRSYSGSNNTPKRKAGRPGAPCYRYRGQDIKGVWMRGEARAKLARHLKTELRLVIGFWQMPGFPTKQKAAICGCRDSGEYLELNRKLLQEHEFTRIEAIRHCIVHGLPPSASVHLPEYLLCPGCGFKTSLFPCLRCCKSLDDDPASVDGNDKEDIALAAKVAANEKYVEPTTARPGSFEKVEVLRKRASLKQPLWHPDDPVDLHRLPASFWPGDI